jgi:hypothetical protein
MNPIFPVIELVDRLARLVHEVAAQELAQLLLNVLGHVEAHFFFKN